MLDLRQIEAFYPENLRAFKQNILREYFQYKILEIIFDSAYGRKMAFMGGTCLRIAHALGRFSEDLDFDNLGLNKSDFGQLAELIKKRLGLEGYKAEVKNVFKGAFRSYIRISNVLFESGLSGHKQAKILIQVDTEKQSFRYQPGDVLLNKFDIFLRIKAVPVDILLAQKIYAVFNRKRAIGRDFYDTVFLLGRTKPNMKYLEVKLKISQPRQLKERLLARCEGLNFKRLAGDVEHFLIVPEDIKKVLHFKDYMEAYDF